MLVFHCKKQFQFFATAILIYFPVYSLTILSSVPPKISNVKGTFEVTDIRELVSITTGAVVTVPKGVAIRIRFDLFLVMTVTAIERICNLRHYQKPTPS